MDYEPKPVKQSAIRELARRELERRKMREDDFYFVENYVWIENKEDTATTNKVLFNLWAEQKQAWIDITNHKKVIVPKARQIGITWLAIARALKWSLDVPGHKTIILSQSDDYAKEAVLRSDFILSHLPEWLVQRKTTDNMMIRDIWLFEYTSRRIVIWHPIVDGEARAVSIIEARPSTKSAARSLTCDFLIFDEWAYHDFAEAVFAAAYPTINRVGAGHFLGISTNQRGSFFEQVVLERIKRGFHLVFISVWADPKRNDAWYEQTKNTLPDSWMQEYPESIEQALSAGERTALPEFSRSIHVCETFTPPKHWPRWMGMDNGYDDPFAWYKFAVNEDGTVFIYYEYTRKKHEQETVVSYTDQAAKVWKDSTWKEFDEYQGEEVEVHDKIQYIAAGLDAWATHHRDQSGKNLVDYYMMGGIKYPFIKPITDRKLRLATWHEYLKPYTITVTGPDGKPMEIKTAKLQIMDCCPELIRTLPLLVKDKNDPEKVEDDNTIDHGYDGAGYGLITYHLKNSLPKKKELSKFQKHKQQLLKQGQRKGMLT